MAEMTPLNIQIDEQALREQIQRTLDDVLVAASWKLRQAADALDPGFLKYQDDHIEQEIDRRVAKRLEENNG